eukprot:Phypoly_transcript_14608.p1 GENE.Phypoly_transcript_14608~~Phypoly_transcript_14608.p1  ORF type:complete len:275 (+),score=56.87 Phypoly_transcript_14608:100-924(+)
MQNPHGIENALSSGEGSAGGGETRNSKRLKTKHNNKSNTTSSGGNSDNTEMEHSKNSKDKHTRLRSEDHVENPREKNVNGGGNSGTEDDGGKKRQEALGNMEKIEKEFTDLKEKFFKDKIGQLKKEVDAIKNGTHPQFCEQCKELDDIKIERIAAAEQWKQYQLQNINNMFEAERLQAEEECTTEKRLLKDRLINTILDKKKKISEDKMTMNITDPTDTRTNTRQLRRRGAPPPPPPVTQTKKKLTPPSINYTLKDTEIQEDLNAIFNKQSRTR